MLAGYIDTLKAMVAPDADDEAKRALLATLVEKVTLGDSGPSVHFSFAVPPLGNCPPPHPDDSPGVAARAAPPIPRLPLPGLRAPGGRGASHPTLGTRRPDHALQPRAPLSLAPPRGPRGGLSGRPRARRHAPVPAAGRPPAARRPAAGRGTR